MLWDVNVRAPKTTFVGHSADVMSVSLNAESSIFVSGSCDANAKVWDPRQGSHYVHSFPGHESDINSVDFYPDGQVLIFADTFFVSFRGHSSHSESCEDAWLN